MTANATVYLAAIYSKSGDSLEEQHVLKIVDSLKSTATQQFRCSSYVARGGIVGVCLSSHFLSDRRPTRQSLPKSSP